MSKEQKQVQDGGNATFSVKVTQAVYDLVNILCEGLERGTNGNDLMKKFIQTFIESAKHDGPVSPEMKTFLNMLRIDPGWHKAFNFADSSDLIEVAQVVLILQQQGRHGFGLTMIDKPFMGEPTETRCVDDILERVMKVSMPGLYKRLDQIGDKFCCTSIRETLTLLCEYMVDYLHKEEDRQEMPGYGEYHEHGKPVEYGKRTKRVHHKTPDSITHQQTIRFGDIDRETAQAEVEEWEGEHRQHDDPSDEMEKEFGFKPIGGEW